MKPGLEDKMSHLEMLYSEQEHTVQTLNEVVAQQDIEIARLNTSIEQIKIQLQALRSELSPDMSSDNEAPPHY
ncbi:MAG: SlyX protein [Planctomycetota bacterium]